MTELMNWGGGGGSGASDPELGLGLTRSHPRYVCRNDLLRHGGANGRKEGSAQVAMPK